MLHLTCPAEVRARDDWLPAHTFLMMNPCRASMTLGRYTRLVSPWPSLPAGVSHVCVTVLVNISLKIDTISTMVLQFYWRLFSRMLLRVSFQGVISTNIPLSPPPKDHTVRPSCATTTVWELPQATCPTPLTSFTSVGTFRLWLSLWPAQRSSTCLLPIRQTSRAI